MKRSIEQILNLYNYVDGIVITDTNGIIEHFQSFRPEINSLKEEEVLGKYILEIYPTLNERKSSILRVLKSGQPIYNEHQQLKTFNGLSIYAINSTLPIKSGDKIVGAVEVSRYLDPNFQRMNVSIKTNKEKFSNNKHNLFSLNDIITKNSSMLHVKEKIRRISRTNSSVLIYGETGTGKELVAQAIHTESSRRHNNFISQNCAAIPSSLLEGILFGTVKGSYTGAENKVGLFQMADGGTLFLDEIHAMDVSVQAKLLKAIEEQKIWRIGGTKSTTVNVRIIAAVNEDPIKLIEEGNLREDLFYRIAVVQINISPLRERKEDINILVKYFINLFNEQMSKDVIDVNENVNKIFQEYSWPGNVRELKNVIECAFNLTANNYLAERDLPEYLKNSSTKNNHSFITEELGENSLKEHIENYEKKLMIKALALSENKAEAARLLKISKQSLNYKLDKYNIK